MPCDSCTVSRSQYSTVPTGTTSAAVPSARTKAQAASPQAPSRSPRPQAASVGEASPAPGSLRQHGAALAGAPGEPPLLRGLCMAILDEADAILLDEACVPLVIARAAPNAARRAFLWQALAIARRLGPADHQPDAGRHRRGRGVGVVRAPGRDHRHGGLEAGDLGLLGLGVLDVLEGLRLRVERLIDLPDPAALMRRGRAAGLTNRVRI